MIEFIKRFKKIAHNKRYRELHREQIAEYRRKWKKNNPEKLKAEKKRYRENNPNKVKEWKKNNPEKVKEHRKRDNKRRKQNPTSRLLYHIRQHKAKTKRKRNLGFNELNEWFPGSHAHHINYTDVVHIPKDIHIAYPHNLDKPETMIKINSIASQYLKPQTPMVLPHTPFR